MLAVSRHLQKRFSHNLFPYSTPCGIFAALRIDSLVVVPLFHFLFSLIPGTPPPRPSSPRFFNLGNSPQAHLQLRVVPVIYGTFLPISPDLPGQCKTTVTVSPLFCASKERARPSPVFFLDLFAFLLLSLFSAGNFFHPVISHPISPLV